VLLDFACLSSLLRFAVASELLSCLEGVWAYFACHLTQCNCCPLLDAASSYSEIFFVPDAGSGTLVEDFFNPHTTRRQLGVAPFSGGAASASKGTIHCRGSRLNAYASGSPPQLS